MAGTEHDHETGDPADEAERLEVFGPPAEIPDLGDLDPCPICGTRMTRFEASEYRACEDCYLTAFSQGLRIGRRRSKWGRSRSEAGRGPARHRPPAVLVALAVLASAPVNGGASWVLQVTSGMLAEALEPLAPPGADVHVGVNFLAVDPDGAELDVWLVVPVAIAAGLAERLVTALLDAVDLSPREDPMSNPELFARYAPALRIECPSCRARPCQPCKSRKGRMTAPHPSRVTRATEGPRRRFR